MCGLVGILFGTKRRRMDERAHLAEVFTRLLELSEERGPHATGVAWVNRDGEHALLKHPLPARVFTLLSGYPELLAEIDNRATILMGHTRWRTRGSEANNRNNHPIRAGDVLGTHNGTIVNAEALFRRFRMRPQTEVDTEVLVRAAAAAWADGTLDIEDLKDRIALCRGQLTAVLASRADPGRVIVLKGNKPLALWWHRKHRVVAYASDPDYLDKALAGERGWREILLPEMHLAVFDAACIAEPTVEPFTFIARSPARSHAAQEPEESAP
jgi:glucosamine 6-phosphate synthetase-like amidotransferase/phosphosugar isomerase protein